MKKCNPSYLLAFVAAIIAFPALVSCNSENTWGYDPEDYSGTQITGFNLKADANVLNNLDSVFFSINQIDASIYNAAPIPAGTDVTSIGVNISSDQVSVIEITQPAGDETEEKVVDYISTPDEKISFANGPVRIRLVSADGANERTYIVTLNVAKDVTDSLYWDKVDAGKMRMIQSAVASKTVKAGRQALTLSRNAGGNVAISTFVPASGNGGGNWDSQLITPTFDGGAAPALDVATFTASADGSVLGVVASNGTLFTSSDGGATFTTAAAGWVAITTPYADGFIGVTSHAGSYSYASWPASVWPGASAAEFDTEFPVAGTSSAVGFSSKWASKEQMIITGGLTASGIRTSGTWAFDGNAWARISDKLPSGSGWSLAAFTIAVTDSATWQIDRRNVLIAIGGLDHKPYTDVYVSRDMGVNWKKGSEELQLPEYIPFATGASLIVFEKTMTDAAPAAIKPITEWQCPYLYLFGGESADGVLLDDYWSGTVNYLTRKPLQ